ncbi:hypothetical protein C8R42DRAFT_472916 [Lentinula raphanica]|nr:hypothetical protein C8R42DRAFT_472916 [Lentinula raphanica]
MAPESLDSRDLASLHSHHSHTRSTSLSVQFASSILNASTPQSSNSGHFIVPTRSNPSATLFHASVVQPTNEAKRSFFRRRSKASQQDSVSHDAQYSRRRSPKETQKKPTFRAWLRKWWGKLTLQTGKPQWSNRISSRHRKTTTPEGLPSTTSTAHNGMIYSRETGSLLDAPRTPSLASLSEAAESYGSPSDMTSVETERTEGDYIDLYVPVFTARHNLGSVFFNDTNVN